MPVATVLLTAGGAGTLSIATYPIGSPHAEHVCVRRTVDLRRRHGNPRPPQELVA